jgi:hypothetical protein
VRILAIILIQFCLLGHTSFAQKECKMMFFNDFNDTSAHWIKSKQSKIASYNIKDGYYYIEGLKKRKAVMDLYQLEIDEDEDFEIETSITKVSTIKKNAYGICFGFSDAGNFFGFIVNYNGKFSFFKYEDGTRTEIIPWTVNEHINQGTGSINRLMIKKEEGQLKFYSNGSLVATSSFQGFFGDKIGFYIQNKQKVAVDYIRVFYSRK